MIDFLQLSAEIFNDLEIWGERGGYGGLAWAKITETLLKITKLKNELDKVRSEKPTNMEKEMHILQQLVVELNVFDGLNHNTGNILSNILEEERKDLLRQDSVNPLGVSKEFDAVQKLMDAKELMDPTDVYKEIEETLKETDET